MNTRQSNLRRCGPYLFTLLLIATSLLSAPVAQAAPKYGNSLDWVPADVAFYSSSLRMGEQIEIVRNSKAWAKLTSMPALQMVMPIAQMALNQPGGPMEQVHQFFAEPENKELLAFLGDAFSSEVMAFGDQHAANALEIVMRTINAVQYGSMIAEAHGGGDSHLVNSRIVLNSLDASRDRLNAPGLVIGFKLANTDRAKSQLKRLEDLVKPLVEDNPQLRGRLKRAAVGGATYLTLELDGSMVPWHEVPWGELAEKPGQYDALKAKLQGMKLVVSLGVRNDYLLLAVGGSTQTLASLGSGKLLADQPELKSLAKYADKRLVDVTYVSKSMLQALSNPGRDMDELVQVARQLLPEAGLPEEANKQILKDVEEFSRDLKGYLPEPGAQFSFSFLTPQGVEGYAYDWSQNLYWDATKPLGVLEHAGGNPLLVAAGRGKYSPQQYDMLRKWIIKGFGYFEQFAVPEFSGEQKEHYVKVKEIALPLVERLDKATGQMLIPALRDGQSAFVLDAKSTSKNWFEGLPQNGQSLPMLEPALVFGVSDVALLKKAFVEYRSIADAVVEKVKQIHPGEIPADFKLPAAETREVKPGNTVYWYKLPADIGIDSQFTPNAGLSGDVAVLSLAPAQTARLLASTPLAVSSGGPLANRSRPLASAVFFSWAGTVDAITPWIDFAVRQWSGVAAQGAGFGLFLADDKAQAQLVNLVQDDPNTKMILDQVHIVLDVLKTFRSVESASFEEGGAMVTHSLTVIQDIP